MVIQQKNLVNCKKQLFTLDTKTSYSEHILRESSLNIPNNFYIFLYHTTYSYGHLGAAVA
jgi:hypothetical protein